MSRQLAHYSLVEKTSTAYTRGEVGRESPEEIHPYPAWSQPGDYRWFSSEGVEEAFDRYMAPLLVQGCCLRSIVSMSLVGDARADKV